MKALFLLLIIYSLHNLARTQNESKIVHKTYPKKVHPGADNVKLVNTGAYYKKSEKPVEAKKSFTRFEAPVPEWISKKKVLDTGDTYFPIESYGNIKSRVKKIPYFSDKGIKRAKRSANETQSSVQTSPPPPTTEKPKAKDNEKPSEPKPVAPVSPKNASTLRRSAAKPNSPAKPALHTKTAPKHNQPNKIVKQVEPAKKVGLRPNKIAKQFETAKKAGLRPNKIAKKVEPAKKTGLRRPKRPSRPRKLQVKGKKLAMQKHSQRSGKKRPSGKANHAPANKGKGVKRSARKPPLSKPQSKVQPKGKVNAKASRRLIWARDAHQEDYPFVVSIQKDGQHWCTGSILNPTLIITSANCFWKSRAVSRMKIRAGAKNADEGGQTAHIAEVRKHPDWSVLKDPDNDVALALLDRPLKFSDRVHGVDLPNKIMMPAFDDAWIASYGADRRDGIFSRGRMVLQEIYVRLMPRSVCNNITIRFNVAVTENFICLEQAGRRSPCTRDTGAPAVSDGVLWGVASWGIRKLCGTERFPAMFSYLASRSNMNFIMNATSDLMGDKRLSPLLDRPLMQYRSVKIDKTPTEKPLVQVVANIANIDV